MTSIDLQPCPCGDAGAWLNHDASPPGMTTAPGSRGQFLEPSMSSKGNSPRTLHNGLPQPTPIRGVHRQVPCRTPTLVILASLPMAPRLPARHRRLLRRVQQPAQQEEQGRVVQDHARPTAHGGRFFRELRHETPYRNLDPGSNGQPPHRSHGGAVAGRRLSTATIHNYLQLPAHVPRLDRQVGHGARAEVRRRRLAARPSIGSCHGRPRPVGQRTSTSPARSRRSPLRPLGRPPAGTRGRLRPAGQGGTAPEAPRRHRHQRCRQPRTQQRSGMPGPPASVPAPRAGAPGTSPSRRRRNRNCSGPGHEAPAPGHYVRRPGFTQPSEPGALTTSSASSASEGRPWRRVAWPAPPIRQRPLRGGTPAARRRCVVERLALRATSRPGKRVSRVPGHNRERASTGYLGSSRGYAQPRGPQSQSDPPMTWLAIPPAHNASKIVPPAGCCGCRNEETIKDSLNSNGAEAPSIENGANMRKSPKFSPR